MSDRELEDPTNNETTDIAAQEVRTHCFRYALLGVGAPMSILGIGGAILNVITDVLNRYVFHMGKEKWILHAGLWLIGLLGVLLIILAFPSARKFICRCCMNHRRKRRQNLYGPLSNDAYEA